MKKFVWRALFFLVPFLYSIYASSQPEKDCSATCFSSQVISVEDLSPSCRRYSLKVSYSGQCAHALSHYSVGVPCGDINDIWNSENWKQAVGTDPTTGLIGLKIDDISGFGESSLTTFTVKFTVCASGDECVKSLKCWQPIVAYKASTCVNYETVEVGCKTLKASLTYQNVSCFGAADGSLAVVIEDGEGPFTYSWSNGSTEQSVAELIAGSYSATVKDASGSELVLEKVLMQPEPLLIQGSVTPATCNGMANGAISLTVSGGTAPFTFSWNIGSASKDISQLSSGQYSVSVTDAGGCSAIAGFTIGNAAVINLNVVTIKPDCNNANGSIDLTVTGGSPPYIFQWSDGSAAEDLNDVGTGLYSVIVTDNVGCSAQKSVLMRENNTLLIRGVPTATGCNDDATGGVDITLSGGTAPYFFSWSNGETSEDIYNLTAGQYTVRVEDSKGCFVTASFSVTKATFQVPRTIVQPSCYGEQNGSIALQNPIGGTGPYTYLWSNGSTGTTLTDLAAGSYSLTVTDATGCSRTFSMIISSPAELAVSATVSSSPCDDDDSDLIDLTVSGGAAPYTYHWSNGETTEDIQSLIPGTYTVVVTDANGCTATKEVVVLSQDPPLSCMINPLSTMPACGTAGNILSASIVDADSYSWAVVSSDNSWAISSGNLASVAYIAGGPNTSATFTLTITKNGCSKTCSYDVSACTSDDPHGEGTDGGEPGGENPGGEIPDEDVKQDCDECMNTTASLIASSGNCRTYEMKITTNGLCEHDLSHWTVTLPCGTVSDLWNSAGWAMVIGKDPTTGLYGLKVDDISGFEEVSESFAVRFTICQSSCDAAWDPVVAYKAGQCVAKQNILIDQSDLLTPGVAAYPNPFNDMIHFEWRAAHEKMNLDIIDQYGNVVMNSTQPARSLDGFYLNLASSSLPKGMYYYRLTIDGKTYHGKISKR